MHTSLWFLALALQTPSPVAPLPPVRRPPVSVAAPETPRPARAPKALHDQLNLSGRLMELPDFEFEFPHMDYLPVLPPLPPMEFQLPAEPFFPDLPVMPMQLMQQPLLGSARAPEAFWSMDDAVGEAHGKLSRMRPEQGSPEDSLFRRAREALSRGEYARASTLFQSLEQKFPRSRVAPSAMYWRAFALYRSGSSEELRTAVEALKAQQERYPDAAADPDAAVLRTRLYAALAARGDAQAASMVRSAGSQGPTCDREDMEVRAEALNALAQLDAPEARPTLKRVLARRDECSVTLRRRAVYILGRSGTEESATDLLEVVKNDPDAGVRSDAIMFIGRSAGTATVKTLEQLFNESTDEGTKAAALSALRSKGGPDAKRVLRGIIEKGDLPERTRAQAIQQLAAGSSNSDSWVVRTPGGELTTTMGQRASSRPAPSAEDEENGTFLRGLYPKTDSRTVKSAIISAVGRIGGSSNDQWLLALAKNKEEDSSLRREALSRIKTSSLSIEELGKLFDALPERELRYAVVSQLASREEPAAVDKLIEIAKSGTDPQVRRQAIAALARKNDPRTTKLLLDLVEKP